MNYEYILENIDKIKIGNVDNDKDKNIVIPVLYDNKEFSVKIPKSRNKYFELHQLNDNFFNYYLSLELMEYMDEFEEEYKNNNEKLIDQKESVNFSNFIIKLKNKIIESFFNELKVNEKYLNMINLNHLNLEKHEIDRAIWNENIDFSYIPEIKETEQNFMLDDYNDNDNNQENEINFETTLRHRFHLNKITKKDKDLILKCNIIFINKKLDDKKHIFINWFIV